MKKTINQLLVICLLSILCNPITGQPRKNDSICMEITGRVLHLNTQYGNSYKAELLFNNIVLDSAIVQNHKMFKFSIPKNSCCAIRISKAGYVTRLISIYSQLNQSNSGFYRFDFDTELIEEKRAEKLNPEVLDFPIAIISYDTEMNCFYYNEDYTSNIKRDLFYKYETEHVPASFLNVCPR